MATRLYLPPEQTGIIFPILPAIGADWDAGGASFARALASRTKTNKAFANQNFVDTSATANRDTILAQFIYALPVGTVFATTQTVKGRVLAFENAATHNLRSQCIIRVIASDATTVRATLLAADLTTGTANPTSEWALAATNRQMPRGASQPIAANYTSVLGDCLVIEQGFRKHTTTNGNGSIRYGDNSATDLPEDETTTADNNTWIEFSANFPIHENVIVTAADLALGATVAAAAVGGSVATTRTDLALGSTAATASAGARPTTTAGGLTLGATTATPSAGSQAALTASDLALGSTAAGMSAGTGAAVSPATLALDTTAATAQAGSRVDTAPADLSLGTTVAAASAGSQVAAVAADLALGGTEASVDAGGSGDQAVNLLTGDLLLGESVLGGSAGAGVTTTPGDLTLDGQPVALIVGATVAAAPSDLILSGGELDAATLVAITTLAGDLALAGSLIALTAGGTIVVTPGDLALQSTLLGAAALIIVPPAFVLAGRPRERRLAAGRHDAQLRGSAREPALTGVDQSRVLVGTPRSALVGRES